jgi:hypothetical protein
VALGTAVRRGDSGAVSITGGARGAEAGSREEDEDNRRWKTIGVTCSPCAIGVLPLKNKIARTLKKLNSAEYASEG